MVSDVLQPKTKSLPDPTQYMDVDHESSHDEGTVYYDWKKVESWCREPEPNHEVYGKTIEEYRKCRKDIIDSKNDENSKPVRMGFRVDPFVAKALTVISRNYRSSTYPHILLLLEMGMIKFQKDYHEQYTMIQLKTRNLYEKATDQDGEYKFLTAQKQTISLGTGIRTNACFTPSVPRWVANTIKDYSLTLNMSITDMANVCLYIGLESDHIAMQHPGIVKRVQHMKDTFDTDIKYLKLRIDDLIKYI